MFCAFSHYIRCSQSHPQSHPPFLNGCVYMYVYIYVYIYTYVYVYIYTHIYIYVKNSDPYKHHSKKKWAYSANTKFIVCVLEKSFSYIYIYVHTVRPL